MAQKLKDLIVVLVDQLQDLEYVFQDLKNLTTLENSSGVQLDGIGDLVGLPRFTNDDNLYRDALIFQISLNNSNGTPEDIMSFLHQQTGSTLLSYLEAWPAKAIIHITCLAVNIPVDLQAQTERVAPAGVGIFLSQTEAGDLHFSFDLEGGVDPFASGFSEPNYLPDAGLGGSLAETV